MKKTLEKLEKKKHKVEKEQRFEEKKLDIKTKANKRHLHRASRLIKEFDESLAIFGARFEDGVTRQRETSSSSPPLTDKTMKSLDNVENGP